jgi:hypothetical protein
MIATESAPPRDPGNAAFNHPSSGKRAESFGKELIPLYLGAFGHQHSPFGNGEGANRLHGPAQAHFKPGDHLASVVAIAPQQLHLGKLLLQWRKQGSTTFLIGALGPGDFDGQHMALAIHEQVPFASPDFFFPYRSPCGNHERHWF